MKILIIGLGYAGARFKKAFEACGVRKIYSVTRGDDIKKALAEIVPDVVIISSTDLTHYKVLEDINSYDGFVICEKPFVTQYDDLNQASELIVNKTNFCLNLIERYSEATIKIKEYVENNKLKLIRANFQWGKDRLNDKRKTCGVISEIIHGLDLVKHICKPEDDYIIKEVLGCTSDFSVSGNEVLDSVSLAAILGDAPVTAYSSFVNIVRRRNVDLTFLDETGIIVYANLIYDTPEWDYDHLKIWRPTPNGDEILMEFSTSINLQDKSLNTIRKLVTLATDVVNKISGISKLSQPFPDQNVAISLQLLLNEISFKARKIGPVKYNVGDRIFFNESGNLEKLG